MLDDLLFGVRLMHGLGRGHGFESGCSDQTQTPVVPSTSVKSSVLKLDDIGSNLARAQLLDLIVRQCCFTARVS